LLVTGRSLVAGVVDTERQTGIIVSFLTGSVIDTGENTEVKINTVPLPVVEKSVENNGF
jgi:hypothetical protein